MSLSSSLLLLLAMAACATAAHAGAKSKCPWMTGKYPFDENKIAGDWYIVAGTPLLGPKLTKCPKFSLMPKRSNGDLLFSYKLSGVDPRDGSEFTFESQTMAYKPDKSSLNQGVWRKGGTEKWGEVYKQAIVQTDYDNYAVFLACRPVYNASSNTFGRHFAGQVWSRQTSLSQETLSVLKNLLTSYDVDPAAIETADQSCH